MEAEEHSSRNREFPVPRFVFGGEWNRTVLFTAVWKMEETDGKRSNAEKLTPWKILFP